MPNNPENKPSFWKRLIYMVMNQDSAIESVPLLTKASKADTKATQDKTAANDDNIDLVGAAASHILFGTNHFIEHDHTIKESRYTKRKRSTKANIPASDDEKQSLLAKPTRRPQSE